METMVICFMLWTPCRKCVCMHARYGLLTTEFYITVNLAMASNSNVNDGACCNERLCFICYLQRWRLCNEALIMQNG
jgi:hypothetical protein